MSARYDPTLRPRVGRNAKLIEAVRNGSQAAFTRWVNMTFESLSVKCRGILRKRDHRTVNEAEDVALEILYLFYNKVREGELAWVVDQQLFDAFATVQAKERAIKVSLSQNGRKRRWFRESDLPPDVLDLDSIAAKFDALQEIDNTDYVTHLANMVPEHLMPYARLRLSNCSAREIATQLGVSYANVYRALKKLDEIWHDEDL